MLMTPGSLMGGSFLHFVAEHDQVVFVRCWPPGGTSTLGAFRCSGNSFSCHGKPARRFTVSSRFA